MAPHIQDVLVKTLFDHFAKDLEHAGWRFVLQNWGRQSQNLNSTAKRQSRRVLVVCDVVVKTVLAVRPM
jgi:hypothetical protein